MANKQKAQFSNELWHGLGGIPVHFIICRDTSGKAPVIKGGKMEANCTSGNNAPTYIKVAWLVEKRGSDALTAVNARRRLYRLYLSGAGDRMNRSQQKYSKKRSAGFSLIEFLVASVSSMIVLIAIGSGYFAARKINDVALGRLGVQQDMRNAANLIVRDARMAGSFGCFNMANKEPATVGSDGSASSNTPRNLIAAGQTTGLVPVKSFAGSTFNVTGFTASGNALVFQYGIGSASITGNNNGTMTMQMPADDPLQNISSNMPLVFSSCNVIDRPTSFAVTRSGTGVTINNINPALNTGHVVAEMSILRYVVNAYVIGTTTAGEQGLYRIQLGDDNNWQSPQLLLPASPP